MIALALIHNSLVAQADVFEIDIDTIRGAGSQLFGEVWYPMIDDLVEAQLVARAIRLAATPDKRRRSVKPSASPRPWPRSGCPACPT